MIMISMGLLGECGHSMNGGTTIIWLGMWRAFWNWKRRRPPRRVMFLCHSLALGDLGNRRRI